MRYKDYRIGKYTFTLHLNRDADGDVRIAVFDWHLPPRSWWEHLKQKYSVKCYGVKYWRPNFLPHSYISLEDFIQSFLEEIINKWELNERIEKEWANFCDN